MNIVNRVSFTLPVVVSISVYELVREISTSGILVYKVEYGLIRGQKILYIELREIRHSRLLAVWL